MNEKVYSSESLKSCESFNSKTYQHLNLYQQSNLISILISDQTIQLSNISYSDTDKITYCKDEIAFCGKIKDYDNYFVLVVLSKELLNIKKMTKSYSYSSPLNKFASPMCSSSCLVFNYPKSMNSHLSDLNSIEVILNSISRIYMYENSIFNTLSFHKQIHNYDLKDIPSVQQQHLMHNSFEKNHKFNQFNLPINHKLEQYKLNDSQLLAQNILSNCNNDNLESKDINLSITAFNNLKKKSNNFFPPDNYKIENPDTSYLTVNSDKKNDQNSIKVLNNTLTQHKKIVKSKIDHSDISDHECKVELDKQKTSDKKSMLKYNPNGLNFLKSIKNENSVSSLNKLKFEKDFYDPQLCNHKDKIKQINAVNISLNQLNPKETQTTYTSSSKDNYSSSISSAKRLFFNLINTVALVNTNNNGSQDTLKKTVSKNKMKTKHKNFESRRSSDIYRPSKVNHVYKKYRKKNLRLFIQISYFRHFLNF